MQIFIQFRILSFKKQTSYSFLNFFKTFCGNFPTGVGTTGSLDAIRTNFNAI